MVPLPLDRRTMFCTQLSKHCAATINSSYEDHLADAFACGKEKGVCCAGTIVIDMSNSSIQMQPNRERHMIFIGKIVQSPICLKETD